MKIKKKTVNKKPSFLESKLSAEKFVEEMTSGDFGKVLDNTVFPPDEVAKKKEPVEAGSTAENVDSFSTEPTPTYGEDTVPESEQTFAEADDEEDDKEDDEEDLDESDDADEDDEEDLDETDDSDEDDEELDESDDSDEDDKEDDEEDKKDEGKGKVPASFKKHQFKKKK